MIPLLVPHRYIGYQLNPAFPGINSHGWRGPEIGPKRGFRVCILGDSCVYSKEVPTEKAFPFLIGEKYGLEAINCGTGGYSSWELLLALQFRVLDLMPDLIVVYQGIQDLRARCANPREYRADNSGWRVSDNLVDPKAWTAPFKIVRALLKMKLLARRLQLVDRVSRKKDGFSDSHVDNIALNPPIYFRRNMLSLILTAQTHNIDVLLLSFAFDTKDKYHLVSDPRAVEGFREQDEVLRDLSIKTGCGFMDFASMFRGGFLDGGYHFSPSGHIYAARLIGEAIMETMK